jgi:hypothetical protein
MSHIFIQPAVTDLHVTPEPMYQILNAVACACASDRAQYATHCADVFNSIPSSTIVVQTLWTNIEKQTMKTAVGSIAVSGDTVQKSIYDTGDNVQVEVLATPAFSLRKVDDRRAAISTSCSQFEIVPNAAGDIIGQLIGNGLALKGLTRGSVSVCLPKDQEIPLCTQKYSVLDLALGDSNNRPGVPLQLPVTIDKSNQVLE